MKPLMKNGQRFFFIRSPNPSVSRAAKAYPGQTSKYISETFASKKLPDMNFNNWSKIKTKFDLLYASRKQ